MGPASGLRFLMAAMVVITLTVNSRLMPPSLGTVMNHGQAFATVAVWNGSAIQTHSYFSTVVWTLFILHASYAILYEPERSLFIQVPTAASFGLFSKGLVLLRFLLGRAVQQGNVISRSNTWEGSLCVTWDCWFSHSLFLFSCRLAP